MLYLDFLLLLLLVSARLIGLFTLTPLFNNKSVPTIAKIGFVFFLSYIIFPVLTVINSLSITSFAEFWYYILMEFINGLSFGMVLTLLFSFVYIAGLLVDRNIGFALVSVMNPETNSQIPVSANLYYLLLMLIFFITDMHHHLIRGIIKSYETLPIGTVLINYKLIDLYTELIGNAFEVGVKIAAPFILTILVTNLILGLLSKAMPGMNVFIVGLPLKVFIGLVTFLIVIQFYYDAFHQEMYKILKYFIRIMNF